METQNLLGIRYVPHVGIMAQSIERLAPATEELEFSALPHNAMTDKLCPALEAHPETHYTSVFEYDGSSFVRPRTGASFPEGTEPNPYDAGQKTGELIRRKYSMSGPFSGEGTPPR